MLREFFESYYRLRPVNATFTGVHDHDHRLPDWSPEGLESAAGEMRTLRSTLLAARGSERDLRDVAARDLEMAVAFLDVQIAEHESGRFHQANPSLAIGEALFGTIALMTISRSRSSFSCIGVGDYQPAGNFALVAVPLAAMSVTLVCLSWAWVSRLRRSEPSS